MHSLLFQSYPEFFQKWKKMWEVVPLFINKIWYTSMYKILLSTSILLNSRKLLLVLPQTSNQVQPMGKEMSMLVVHLLGSLQKANHAFHANNALEILLGSWRVVTGKRYNSHIKRFVKFCRERYTDPIQATNEMGTEFLTE